MSIRGIKDSGTKYVTTGLVLDLDAAQLRSYPGSGRSWSDLSGNNNNLTLGVSASFTGSIAGGIIYFNETAGAITSASVNLGTAPPGFQVTTIMAWVWMNKVPPNQSAHIVSFPDANSGAGLRLTDGRQFGFYFGNFNANFTFTGSLWTTGSWNHYVARHKYDTGPLTGTGSMFVNTVKQEFSTGNQVFGATGTQRVIIGALRTFVNSYPDMRMANLQIYNAYLSDEQIIQNYNAQKARFGL